MTGERPGVNATALVMRSDEVLMLRCGSGPAGGYWDLPAVSLQRGETLAEAVIRALEERCGLTSGLCGPFLGWQELLPADEGVDDESQHHVLMYFNAVLLDQSERDADLVAATPKTAASTTDGGVAEVRWVSIYEIPEIRTRDGLVEFLSDQSIIDVVV